MLKMFDANSKGISSLLAGKYAEAEKSFSIAATEVLKCIVDPLFDEDSQEVIYICQSSVCPVSAARQHSALHLQGQQQDQDKSNAESANHNKTREEDEDQQQVPAPSTVMSRLDDSSLPPPDHNTFFLYERAMEVIPPLQGVKEMNTHPAMITKKLVYLSAVFLYNLGLAKHLRGRVESKSRTAAYKNALQLYQRAVNAIREVTQFGAQETEETLLLQLALYNNMAHANYNFYNTSQSRKCLDQLDDALQRCTTFDEEHEMFNINVIAADDQEQRVAPAA